MTKNQAKREARQLFRACLSNELLDEARVRTAVKQVLTRKPRGSQGILKTFLRMVRLDTARHTADVQSAAFLSPDLQTEIRSALKRVYGAGLTIGFRQRPSLIAGTRIQVGSDVYDGSLLARLETLERGFEPR